MSMANKMDVRNWKKIIIQWITECDLIQCNFFNIEQSDIVSFYQNFCGLHPKLCVEIAATKLQSSIAWFLKENYPEFESHFDDENSLSSSEYVYVYTLFLHYSCVKYPESYFHDVCKKLSERCQQHIALFFKLLMDVPKITRETLRHAISEATSDYNSPSGSSNLAYVSSKNLPPQSPKSHASCSTSPATTPKRLKSADRISPPTPKAYILQERTKEIFRLRALLDTERYEKGLLELQIKQNDERTLKLNHDHKKLQQHILELKNDIFARNHDNCSTSSMDEDQFRRRFSKELHQKDQEISKLSDLLCSLKEEKNLVQEKLNYTERQMKTLLDRVTELESKLDDLSQEIDVRDQTICCLTETKNELEQFIAESRLAPNRSSDMLDCSFNRASSSSDDQPENMGVVVDVQLREKEYENAQLREELSKMRDGNAHLAREMVTLVDRHAKDFETILEKMNEKRADISGFDGFNRFIGFVEELAKHYKSEKEFAHQLQCSLEVVQQQNNALTRQTQEYDDEIGHLRMSLQEMENAVKELERHKLCMQGQLSAQNNERENLKAEKADFVATIKKLATDHDEQRRKLQAKATELEQELKDMHTELKRIKTNHAELEQMNVQLVKKLELANEQLRCDRTEYELELNNLKHQLTNHQLEAGTHQEAERVIKEKYEALFIQCEKLKKDARSTDKHLEFMREQLALKEMEMGKLGPEISSMRKMNNELVERIEMLMTQYKTEKETCEALIMKSDVKTREMITEKETVESELAKLRLQFEENSKELEKTKSELTLLAIDVEALNSMLNNPLVIGTLGEVLGRIVEKVDELMDQKLVASRKVEELQTKLAEHKQIVVQAHIELEQQNKAYAELSRNFDETVKKMKKDMEIAKATNENLKIKIIDLKEMHAIELKGIEAEHKEDLENRQMASLCEHTEAMQILEDELKYEQEEKAHVLKQMEKKEAELTEAMAASKEQKQQFNAKLLQLEEQMQKLTKENELLQKNLHDLQFGHTQASAKLTENQESLLLLKEQLQAAHAEKEELLTKQRDLETNLKQCELDKISAQVELAVMADQEKAMTEKQQQLEVEQESQAAANKKLQNELQLANSECQHLSEMKASMDTQLLRVQNEKESLLEALEKTAEQLRRIKDMERKLSALKKECQASEETIKELKEENCQLSTKLRQKEDEMHDSLEEYQQTLEDYRNKASNLVRNLALESDKLDHWKTQIKQMRMMIEGNKLCWIKSILHESKASNIFGSDTDTETDVSVAAKLKQKQQQQEQDEDENIELQLLQQHLSKVLMILQELNKELLDKDEIIGEIECKKSKLQLELKRYQENNENLEKVNEKLSAENARLLDTVERQKKRVNGLENDKDVQIHDHRVLKELVKTLDKQEKTMLHIINQEEEQNQLLQREVCEKENLQQRLERELKEKSAKLLQLQMEVNTFKQEKTKTMQCAAEADQQLLQLQKELQTVQRNFSKAAQENVELQKKLSDSKCRYEEISNKNVSEEKMYQSLHKQHEKLQEAHDLLKQQQQCAQQNLDRLSNELLSMQTEKSKLTDQLKTLQHALNEANMQKDEQAAATAKLQQQNETLCQKLIIQSKCKVDAELQLQEFMQRSQSLEQKLQSAERELKQMREQIAENVSKTKKVSMDNVRLNENVESATKRTEKLAIKLGETQAQLSSAQRDYEKQRDMAKELQSEKQTLLDELHKLKETEQRQQEKIHSLEKQNCELEQKLKHLAGCESELKLKLTKAEKMRDMAEERLRTITADLEQSEQKLVRSNLEIGGLNSQLKEVKQLANEKKAELESQQISYIKANAEMKELREQLQQAHAQCELLTKELQQLQLNFQQLRDEKALIEETHRQTCAKLEFAQMQKVEVQKQKEQQIADLEKQVVKLMADLSSKTEQLLNLQQELRLLQTSSSSGQATLNDELETLRARLTLAETAKERELKECTQLRLDNQILHAKYRDMKKRLDEEMAAAEDRLKQNRLEMEGKLEKMKNKMKTLYNEEVTKLKSRQEREKVQLSNDLEVLNAQSSKYEDQVHKLSLKIVALNDELLELKREKVKSNTKLNYLEKAKHGKPQFKYPSTVCMMQGTSQAVQGASSSGLPNKLSTNLAMEDEEGEIFNNTYLTDLKTGRVSINRTIGSDEIAYRNSLLPPHLQSTYAAQYIDQVTHSDAEDFKDGPPSLDDSMSALLSTTSLTNVRKKISGVTHYKRPGPPTPSKHGGRLSFGSSTEPPREILKETFDDNVSTTSSVKTPARFSLFSSRFSLGNGNNGQKENSPSTRRRLSNIFKKKSH